jgi:hypothetical protein
MYGEGPTLNTSEVEHCGYVPNQTEATVPIFYNFTPTEPKGKKAHVLYKIP